MAIAPPTVQMQKKRGWGCWGCGCGILAAVVLLIIAFLGAGGYYAYHAVRNLTDATAVAVPQFDGGDAVDQAANQKVSVFEQAIEHAQSATLHLSADEINTLIAHNPAYAKRLFVKLTDSDATVQTSVALGSFENVVFTDRYLNGTGSFSVSFDPESKSVNFDLHSLEVKGNEIPASAMSSFNQTFNTSFNSKLQANPAARDFLNRAQKIAIENGELVIETK
jgi:hypothetical protein